MRLATGITQGNQFWLTQLELRAWWIFKNSCIQQRCTSSPLCARLRSSCWRSSKKSTRQESLPWGAHMEQMSDEQSFYRGSPQLRSSELVVVGVARKNKLCSKKLTISQGGEDTHCPRKKRTVQSRNWIQGADPDRPLWGRSGHCGCSSPGSTGGRALCSRLTCLSLLKQ